MATCGFLSKPMLASLQIPSTPWHLLHISMSMLPSWLFYCLRFPPSHSFVLCIVASFPPVLILHLLSHISSPIFQLSLYSLCFLPPPFLSPSHVQLLAIFSLFLSLLWTDASGLSLYLSPLSLSSTIETFLNHGG